MPIYRYVCGKPKKKRCKLNDLPEDYLKQVFKDVIPNTKPQYKNIGVA